jgi:hypothetical protein
MKVIYIGLSDRIGPLQLTLVKEYDATEYKEWTDGTSNDLYSLIDDSNNRWGCLKTNFITLEEHREQIINKILKWKQSLIAVRTIDFLVN